MVTPLQCELAALWMTIRKRRAVNSNENDSCLDYSRIITGVQAFFIAGSMSAETHQQGRFWESKTVQGNPANSGRLSALNNAAAKADIAVIQDGGLPRRHRPLSLLELQLRLCAPGPSQRAGHIGLSVAGFGQ